MSGSILIVSFKEKTLLINSLIAFEMLDQRLNSAEAKCAGGVS
jgi:hypothetical protein